MWVANVAGSNPIEVGTMVMGDAGYIDLQWSSDGIIYLTMVYAASSYGVIEICEDGSCFIRSQESFPYNYAYPSISPDGEYVTFMRMYGGNYSDEKFSLFEQKTGKWFELSLPSWPVSAIWSDDGQNIYFIGVVDNRKVLANTPLDDLTHADILVDDLAMEYGDPWDVAPDSGLMVSAIDYYGLNIYCLQE
jgi:hypothetical protein